MLTVISSPTAVTDEAHIINVLFEEGLEILHVRKPDTEVDELRALIEKIHSKYHHQIAFHQHHEIANDCGIKRLHIPEIKRNEMSEESLAALSEDNNILSTSIHQIEAYNILPASFAYTFFGPVFNSISKRGYTSVLPDDFTFPVQKGNQKVIAIGGVDATNIQQVKQMQFNGAAVLGTIWQKPRESIQQFKAVKKAWQQTDR